MTGETFELADQRLADARFRSLDLTGASFRSVDLTNADFRAVDLRHARFRGVELVDVDIDGEIDGLRVNGVDVGPLVEAELDRRHPDRVRMRPTDAAGFREAWDVLERLWDQTVRRAARLDPDVLHASVDDEWSFIQTLRHLVFATDAWVGRTLLHDTSPWHPLALPWEEMRDTPGVPRDREARPSLDEVMELRRDRVSGVRQVLEGLTDEQLDGEVKPVEGTAWPPPETFPVREVLHIVLNEEWQHRLYAERDLDALTAGEA